MGAWGPGVFSNDTAADVRGAWRDGVVGGEDPIVLTQRLIEGRESDDVEFWTGLAAAQWETGRLDASVRDRALGLISAAADLELWDGSHARRRSLEALARRLSGPQPAPQRLRGPRRFDLGVGVGDVVYVDGGDGPTGLLLHVVDLEDHDAAIVMGLFWEGPGVPTREQITRLPFLSNGDPWRHDGDEPPDWHTGVHPYVRGVIAKRPAQAFGPEIGRVVARDVRPRFRLPRVGEYCGWAAIREDATRVAVFNALTRHRLAQSE